MKTKIYQEIATRLQAIQNCIASNNTEWEARHKQTIADIMAKAPSGSGIDCGTKIELSESNPEKLVFFSEYHHMNESGMYDGWTSHRLIVTPSLAHGFSLRITGSNRNEIKDYLHDVYLEWLTADYKP